ncbi:hypothetical protein B0H11DRAFT_2213384 [Mycena galericulata]|nr:hypothetical protein B0H11DRAFT_2213384 [Mycena galericulata]
MLQSSLGSAAAALDRISHKQALVPSADPLRIVTGWALLWNVDPSVYGGSERSACWEANYSINVGVVPDGFATFPLPSRDISRRRSYHNPGSIIASARVTDKAVSAGASSVVSPTFPVTVGSTTTFNLQSQECAILVLPDGATRERLLTVQKFRKHVAKCAPQWYALASDRLSPSESLFVVTGCDKATSWGIATASTTSGEISTSLKFAVTGAAEGSITPRYEWKDFGSATVRTSRNHGLSRTENQCVFIKGFFVPKKAPFLGLAFDKLKSLRGIFPTMRGTGGRIMLEISSTDVADETQVPQRETDVGESTGAYYGGILECD